MSESVVYALHGFLGQSSDWDFIKKSFSEVTFIADDLFSIRNKIGIEPIREFQGKKIFLGYSLGGRLGLQILKKNAGLFDHYIFISTNPGYPSSATEERKNRVLSDQKWCNKISVENWENFIKEWNSQPVFKGSQEESKRDIKRYDLEKLKKALSEWSLGQQEDFSEIIKMNNHKVTWVIGDRDKKYCEIAENLKNSKVLKDYKVVAAGHRILLDNPRAVAEVVKNIY